MKELRTERTPILFGQHRSGRVVYLNCDTNRSSSFLEDVVEEGKPYQAINTCGKKNLEGIKVMYDETEDVVALIVCEIDSSDLFKSTQKERKWKEKERICIDRDKNVYRWRDVARRTTIYKWNSSLVCKFTNPFNALIIDAPVLLEDEKGNTAWYSKEQFRAFDNLFPHIVPLSGNTMVALEDLASLDKFMTYSEPSMKSGAKQQRLEDLESITSQSIPDFTLPQRDLKRQYDIWTIRSNTAGCSENVYKIATIQRVPSTEPMCVVRTFAATKDDDGKIEEIREGGRIYVGKKEVVSSRSLIDGTFICQPLLNKPIHWNFDIEWKGNEETVKGTMLEYYSSVMNEIPSELRGVAIWCFIKYPIVEQLFKTKETKVFMVDFLWMARIISPEQALNALFGTIHNNEKSLYQKIGLNKYQLQQLCQLMVDNMPCYSMYETISEAPIGIFKWLYLDSNAFLNRFSGQDVDTSHLDNETTDKMVELTKGILDLTKEVGSGVMYNGSFDSNAPYNVMELRRDMARIISKTISVWDINVAMKTGDQLMNMALEKKQHHTEVNFGAARWLSTYATSSTIYLDFCDMVDNLEMQSRIKPYFKDADEMVEMHNEIMLLSNTLKEQVNIIKWHRRAEYWKKWEYSEHDEFIVVAPKVPGDVASEGINLHHCVKSYIPKIVEGETNVMFIRKKDKPDTPFFTVEITDDDIILQVHGFANRNANTEPGLDLFIRKWEKACKLTHSKYNQIR